MWKTVLLMAFLVAAGDATGCIPRKFDGDNIVCVCNSTYCDGTPDADPKIPKDGYFYWYVSAKDGRRLELAEAKFGIQNVQADEILIVNPDKQYQKILGFGGAFTDSTGINLRKLSKATQQQLIKSYFDPKSGSRYQLGRIPLGGTDFSTRPYTYDDIENDVTLKNFSLAAEDYDYKIPYIKNALELNPNVLFVGAAWTAPPWMKTNDAYAGFGFLKSEYYQLYTDYLVKVLDAYASHGIELFALSTGNEPVNAFIPFEKLNSMGWTPDTVANWVANNLGPTLSASIHNKTQILVHDDQRIELPWYLVQMFKNDKAREYASGIAVHWYADPIAPPELLDQTHEDFPEKFILMTEGCIGSSPFDIPKVSLGSWERGEHYTLSIIEYLNHWSAGWIDWNLALDKSGGPTWIANTVDSPIIVNPDADEFFQQPMYYAIKHFSRFIDRESVRISVTETTDIKATAVLTPNNETVVVLYNKAIESKNVILTDLKKGPLNVEVPPLSMNTIIYAQ